MTYTGKIKKDFPKTVGKIIIIKKGVIIYFMKE